MDLSPQTYTYVHMSRNKFNQVKCELFQRYNITSVTFIYLSKKFFSLFQFQTQLELKRYIYAEIDRVQRIALGSRVGSKNKIKKIKMKIQNGRKKKKSNVREKEKNVTTRLRHSCRVKLSLSIDGDRVNEDKK